MNETTQDSPAVERACAFLDEVKEMLRQKNRAYGDSIANPVMVFSKLPATERLGVRIDDKLSRICRGDRSGDENDIGDLIGYLAFEATKEGKAA
jgi:hypothetical protein